MSMKNPNDIIGNRTHYLLACSAVYIYIYIYIYIYNMRECQAVYQASGVRFQLNSLCCDEI